MHELRIHGRGGQGAVLASKILAKAIVAEGKFVTAIPAFGFERRGAPVAAFMRFDDKQIREVTNIYKPNTIISIDQTVNKAVDIFAGIQPHSTWVQATRESIDQMEIPESVDTVGLCDAMSIAMEVFNRAITNTIMLGAFAKATGQVSLESLKKGLESSNFRDAGLEQNIQAIERGYDETNVIQVNRGKGS